MIHWTPEELAEMALADSQISSHADSTSNRIKTGKQATQSHRDACKKWREKTALRRQSESGANKN